MDVVDVLEAEHDAILESFRQIDTAQSLEEKKQKLIELKDVVVAHIAKEDAEIYPVLEHSHKPDSVRLGEVMHSLMNSYAVDFMEAVEDVLQGVHAVGEDVMSSYHESVVDIKNRIKIEESLLFPEYEKVVAEEKGL